MTINTRKSVVSFKVSDLELKNLTYEAEKRNLTLGQTARVVLFESLSGYDENQQSLLLYLDNMKELIDKQLSLIINITSLGAAAGALPLDAESQDGDKLRSALKRHFNNSSVLGKNIVEMIKEGKL